MHKYFIIILALLVFTSIVAMYLFIKKRAHQQTDNGEPVIVTETTSFKEANTYKEIDVKDECKVFGRIIWKGDMPETTVFRVTRDNKCCGDEKPSPRLVVSNETRGVANTVIFLEDVKEGKALSSLGKSFEIDQIKCVYTPHMLVVPLNTEILIKNSDGGTKYGQEEEGILHNVHARGAANFNRSMPFIDMPIKETLAKSGIIELTCDLHNWMSNFMFVVKHPYYAISGERGDYAIEGIPPGEYLLRAWHEGWKIKATEMKENEITAYKFFDPIVIERTVVLKPSSELNIDFEMDSSMQE